MPKLVQFVGVVSVIAMIGLVFWPHNSIVGWLVTLGMATVLIWQSWDQRDRAKKWDNSQKGACKCCDHFCARQGSNS